MSACHIEHAQSHCRNTDIHELQTPGRTGMRELMPIPTHIVPSSTISRNNSRYATRCVGNWQKLMPRTFSKHYTKQNSLPHLPRSARLLKASAALIARCFHCKYELRYVLMNVRDEPANRSANGDGPVHAAPNVARCFLSRCHCHCSINIRHTVSRPPKSGVSCQIRPNPHAAVLQTTKRQRAPLHFASQWTLIQVSIVKFWPSATACPLPPLRIIAERRMQAAMHEHRCETCGAMRTDVGRLHAMIPNGCFQGNAPSHFTLYLNWSLSEASICRSERCLEILSLLFFCVSRAQTNDATFVVLTNGYDKPVTSGDSGQRYTKQVRITACARFIGIVCLRAC